MNKAHTEEMGNNDDHASSRLVPGNTPPVVVAGTPTTTTGSSLTPGGTATSTSEDARVCSDGGDDDVGAGPTTGQTSRDPLMEETAPENPEKQQQPSYVMGDCDEEESRDKLERIVDAIERMESAVAPALQRNVGFTSPPGAFRASPSGGLRRAAADSASSSVVSLGDDSVTRGVDSSVHPPPIEAILVDENSSTVVNRRQDQRNSNNNDDDDDDEMDIFTAEPLASVKEFVSATPRYILIGLAGLCMVMVTTVAVAVIVWQVTDKKENKEYVTHHAVIFGSVSIASEGCDIFPQAADDQENDAIDDALLMGIKISCDAPKARLWLHTQGPGVDCTPGNDGDRNKISHGYVESNDRFCTIPYGFISYVFFDCVTEYWEEGGRTAKVVLVQEPVATGDVCGVDNGEYKSNFVFLHLQRICTVDNNVADDVDDDMFLFLSMNKCNQPSSYTALFGECGMGLPEEVVVDQFPTFSPTPTTSIGPTPSPAPALWVADTSRCPTATSMDVMTEQNAGEVVVFLIENITNIAASFLEQ